MSGTTQETIRAWIEAARTQGATHLIVACDTFDLDDFPVPVLPGEDVLAKWAEYQNSERMLRVMECYSFVCGHSIESQLAEARAWHQNCPPCPSCAMPAKGLRLLDAIGPGKSWEASQPILGRFAGEVLEKLNEKYPTPEVAQILARYAAQKPPDPNPPLVESQAALGGRVEVPSPPTCTPAVPCSPDCAEEFAHRAWKVASKVTIEARERVLDCAAKVASFETASASDRSEAFLSAWTQRALEAMTAGSVARQAWLEAMHAEALAWETYLHAGDPKPEGSRHAPPMAGKGAP